ncbi:hypothetical protein [Vallitalea guaymasensis]|nr:hypothetical protein [Vallitalea guaymasensis]
MYETFWIKQAKEAVKMTARNRQEKRAMKFGNKKTKKGANRNVR